MPVRSSLCTYSPSSMTTTGGSSSSSKYSSILPTSSSLSYGQYKPLSSSNSSGFRSSPSSTGTSASLGTSTLGRYNRLTSHSPASSSSTVSSYSPSSYSPSNASSHSSGGVYKPYSPASSFSSRYGTATGGSSVSPSSRYSSSTGSSTGSIASSSSSAGSDHGYHYKSPSAGSSSLSSSAYSSGGSLASSSYSSPSSSSYTSPYTSRASRRLSSGGVSTSSSSPPLPPGVPCGLVNLGNTCYMNASLQSLYALESFRNLILSRYQEATSHDKVLTHELSDVFKLLKTSSLHGAEEEYSSSSSSLSNNPVSPANFKYAFSRYQTKFSGFGQQDAQEFLRYLINGIHEESNAASKRPRRARPLQAPRTAQEAWSQYRDVVDDSPLVDLLVGQLCSTITCDECQNKSHCWDPFWDLSLPLMTRASGGSTYSWRHTTSQLSDVIDEFTSKEVLDSDERPVCSHCKRATKSTKQISLARLPRLMILHLKKFTNDGYKLTSGEIQINKQLTFNGTQYHLKACISHHGHSSSSGHYTAHCEYASRWFHFDDGRVRDVTQTFDSNKLDDAYVLFYTQTRATGSGAGGSLSQSKL